MEWYVCLQTWYFSGVKLSEEILLGCKKALAYWAISSLTRLEPFLGQEPCLVHFGDPSVMTDLVWVAEMACIGPSCHLIDYGTDVTSGGVDDWY